MKWIYIYIYIYIYILVKKIYMQDAEAKLGQFQYNNKWLYYETRLILILKNKQQNKKIDTTVNLFNMAVISFFSNIV